MKKRHALIAAGTIFGLMTLLQLTRLYLQFPVMVGTTLIPLGANVIGLILFALLCFWMFYALREND